MKTICLKFLILFLFVFSSSFVNGSRYRQLMDDPMNDEKSDTSRLETLSMGFVQTSGDKEALPLSRESSKPWKEQFTPYVWTLLEDLPNYDSRNRVFIRDIVDSIEKNQPLSIAAVAFLLTMIQGPIRLIINELWKICCNDINPFKEAENPVTKKISTLFAMACRNRHVGVVCMMLDKPIDKKGTEENIRLQLLHLSYLMYGGSVSISVNAIYEVYKKAEAIFGVKLLKISGINPAYGDEKVRTFCDFVEYRLEFPYCVEPQVCERFYKLMINDYRDWLQKKQVVPELPPAPGEEKAEKR